MNWLQYGLSIRRKLQINSGSRDKNRVLTLRLSVTATK
jgi:hypothetical protein